MRRFWKIAGSVGAVVYPLMVFFCLVVWKVPIRRFSLCLLAFGIALFLASGGRRSLKGLLFPLFLIIASVSLLVAQDDVVLKVYPLLVTGLMFCLFAGSLAGGDPVVWRLAGFADRSLEASPFRASVRRYCRGVTWVWIGFFICNFCISLWTLRSGDMGIWAVYNGGISYLLMGILFGGEFLVRNMVNARSRRTVLLSATKRDSRPDDLIVCWSGRWSDGKFLYWKDYVQDVAKVRSFLEGRKETTWVLHSDDFWYFDVAFAALCQCGKTILLTANTADSYLDEIMRDGTGMLCDRPCGRGTLIGEVLASPVPADLSWRAIDPKRTVLYLYTSGSTGTPKAVRHTLYEMELDNGFVLGKWGDAFRARKVVSSVNPHHIFGFLFAALRPVAIAVPFRRERIVQPDELETQTDITPLLISTPAFLKRCIEDPDLAGGVPWKDPMIVVSGGPLSPKEAEATRTVLGYWPIELYGSTETSGIAWRRSCDGLSWAPFDAVGIRTDADGCLVINSPYAEEGKDFPTSDLVELGADGKFLLLGRKDNVVKIEEKRISLSEVEARIRSLGLTSDCAVVALSDTRQYLAAVVVLNEAGHARLDALSPAERLKFWRTSLAAWFEPIVIPRKWRYVDRIPQNEMGKKQRSAIEALFR